MTLDQEFRYRLTSQIMTKSEYRKKVLKIDRFYFNEPIDGVAGFYKLPTNVHGQQVSFANMKGSTLRKILRTVESGDIYGWINYKGNRCKVKPKKIAK